MWLTTSSVVDTAVVSSEPATPDGFLCSTEVVNCSVKTHVRLHINSFPQVGHDAVDAGLEVVPSAAVC